MAIIQEINEIRANMRDVPTLATEEAIHHVLFGFVGFVRASRTLEDHEECVVVANLITDLQAEFRTVCGERARPAVERQNDFVQAAELEEMATRGQQD